MAMKVRLDNPCSQYAAKVAAGDIVAGPYVRAACERHLRDLEESLCKEYPYEFLPSKAKRFADFCERIIVLEDPNPDAPKGAEIPMRLLDFQHFIMGSLFGWRKKSNGRRRFSEIYWETGKGSAKACAVTTPVLTANRGIVKHGDLKPGDFVFGSDGRPTMVIERHPNITPEVCYEMEFATGESIVCNPEHLWKTATQTAEPGKGASCGRRKGGDLPRESVKEAREIYRTLHRKHGVRDAANHSVESCPPLDFEQQVDLPVPPYTLGVWLGDGDKTDPVISSADIDSPEVMRCIEAEGFSSRPCKRHFPNHLRWHIEGLREALKGANLIIPQRLAKGNTYKHIPDVFFSAPIEDRLALMRGLLDSDGSPSRKARLIFTNQNLELVYGMARLARSLGYRVSITATHRKKRPGVVKCSTLYSVSFPGKPGVRYFNIGRKQAKVDAYFEQHRKGRYTARNAIRGMREVPGVPCNCISVAAEDGLYHVGETLIQTHNSPTMAAALLYILTALNGYKETHIVGAAQYSQAGEICREIGRMVERSPELIARVKIQAPDDPSGFIYRNRGTVNSIRRVAKAADARGLGRGTSGPIVTTAVIDELHEAADDSLYTSFTYGLKNAKDGLIVCLTNSGPSLDDFCGRQHQRAVEVVKGERKEDHLFAYIAALDAGDDPDDESVWKKALPGLGVTIPLERVRQHHLEAQGLPEREGEFQRRFLSLWGTDSSENLFSLAAWKSVEVETHDESVISKLPCFLALDLSMQDDLTALTALWVDFKAAEDFIVYGRSLPFLPSQGIRARQVREKVPYMGYAKAGYVKLCEGPRIEYLDVARAVKDLIERYDVRAMAYDPWKMELMKDALLEESVHCWERPPGVSSHYHRRGIELVKHPQRGQRGKDALWPEGSIRALEEWVVNKNLKVEHNPVLRHQASSSSSIYRDPGSGNRRFQKHTPKVIKNDCIVSFAFGCGLAERYILRLKERARHPSRGAPDGFYD